MIRRTSRAAVIALLLASDAHATPVTIEQALAQDPKGQTGSVTIIETQECCEKKGGIPWWPFLLAGAIPLAFIDRNHEAPPEITLPPSITTPTPNTTPVPEPHSLALGLLGAVGLFVWRKRR
jgi:MYXO-CTERM domain-containing protein